MPEGLRVIYFGSGKRFGITPLPAGRIDWWATMLRPPGGGEGDQQAELLQHFDAWRSGVPALIHATPSTALRRDDLVDADEPGWGDDHAVAIGDAARPILPTLGMAGTVAIEDASVLSDEMNRGPGVAQRVRERRSKRVHRRHGLSRIASRVGHTRGAGAAVRIPVLSATADRCVFQAALELQRKDVKL